MEDSHAQEPLHQGFGSFQAFHNIAWPGCTATAEIEISSRCNYKNRGHFEKKKNCIQLLDVSHSVSESSSYQ